MEENRLLKKQLEELKSERQSKPAVQEKKETGTQNKVCAQNPTKGHVPKAQATKGQEPKRSYAAATKLPSKKDIIKGRSVRHVAAVFPVNGNNEASKSTRECMIKCVTPVARGYGSKG